MLSLQYMLNQYETLKTLSIIAEASPKPTQYHCTPRELILQSKSDWDTINNDLQKLEKESLVEISQGDTPRFCITDKGIEKLRRLEGISPNTTIKINYR
jgi:predicted transcriptional regulator